MATRLQRLLKSLSIKQKNEYLVIAIAHLETVFGLFFDDQYYQKIKLNLSHSHLEQLRLFSLKNLESIPTVIIIVSTIMLIATAALASKIGCIKEEAAINTTQEQLVQNEHQYQLLLDNIPYRAWLKDKESRYIAVNQPFAKACQLHPNELVGKVDLDIFSVDLAQQYCHEDQQVIKTGKRHFFEENIVNQEGKNIWLEIIKTPIINDQGEVIGITGIAQDITERKQAEIAQAQLLQQSRLAAATAQEQAAKLEQTLQELQQTQAQLIQSEKMSSLGMLVAGIAHEINNPINFISGNLAHAAEYSQDLLDLVQLYAQHYPQPVAQIQDQEEKIDLGFIQEDLPKIISSMKTGAERIRQIVVLLRNFSRLDEAEKKWVNIHEGIDNTLLILAHRLSAKSPDSPGIQVIKDYGNLPAVQCYAGQLNQVFMNILTNAIDAIDGYRQKHCPEERKNYSGTILISTLVFQSDYVIIMIGDNGLGMKPEVSHKVFDPFYTTKPVGSATGLGMSISYKIVVEQHRGELQCISAPGKGTAFLIQIPIQQPSNRPK